MGYDRRLPIYLLLDCSESMAGEPIEAVRSGLQTMIASLRTNPMALETAALSVITFASTARQLVPLTDLLKFQVPEIIMGSGTALGAALDLWRQCMAREVVKSTPNQKGDYKPICFLLTDGEPTDTWERAADEVRTKVLGKHANVIAAACGPDAELTTLRRITEIVVRMHEATPETLAGFFKWVSASVSTASQKFEGAEGTGVALPGLPPQLEMATDGGSKQAPDPQRFVFLHARCVKQKSFYILRFKRASDSGWFGAGKPIYKGVASHAVDKFEESAGGSDLKVAADQLQDQTPCPYCSNPLWAMCTCGRVLCCPTYTGRTTLTCPWCNKTDQFGNASFDVGRGRG